MLRQHFKDVENAFAHTSFDPEKRAVQTITCYSEELEADIRQLGQSRGYPDLQSYEKKYIEKFLHWMSSRSRCLSPMITGPANFPVARNQKHNRWADKAYEDFRNWRDRYIKAVNRVPTPSPEEEIDNALKELDTAIEHQELMKQVNKIAKKKNVSTPEKIQLLIDSMSRDFEELYKQHGELYKRRIL